MTDRAKGIWSSLAVAALFALTMFWLVAKKAERERVREEQRRAWTGSVTMTTDTTRTLTLPTVSYTNLTVDDSFAGAIFTKRQPVVTARDDGTWEISFPTP